MAPPQTEDELEEAAAAPEGANGLSARNMFIEREYYKENVYPRALGAPPPLDLWYVNPLFGRLDQEGNPMFPASTYMKQLLSDTPNVWAFDFVVDAFNDFKTEFLFVNKRDVAGTPFAVLNPQRGWTPAVKTYDNYTNFVYERFTNYVDVANRDKEITTFGKFMDVLYDFISQESPPLPFTLSQYIVSPNCSPTISGLMFDISLDLHGNDASKYNNFISNPNFICYAQTAKQFGFKVDKNFPGRLIADINSPVMTRGGDPTIPPRWGGQGYLRRYPKKPPAFKQKPPKSPQLPALTPPTPTPPNLFEEGDRVSFLISRKKREPGQTAPNEWLILRDYTTVTQRVSSAGSTQKNVQQNGTTKKALNEIKAKLKRMGYVAPKKVEGIILNRGVTPWQRRQGDERRRTGEQGCLEAGSGQRVRCPMPEEAVNRLFTTSYFMSTNPNVMVIQLSDRSARYVYPTAATLLDTFRGLTVDNAMVETTTNDGYEYSKAVNREGPILEVPSDAIHISALPLSPNAKRSRERASYPARLQKYNTQLAEATRLFQLKTAKYNIQRAKYRAAKLANKLAWDFYKNPQNQLTADNLFDRRYTRTYLEDLFMLKEICMQFYYSYVSDNPVTTVTKLIRSNGQTYLTKVDVIEREQITKDFIDEKYPETYWVKQFILIRNAELETKKTFDQLRIIRRRAMSVYEKDGLFETLKYIKDVLPAKAYESVMLLDA